LNSILLSTAYLPPIQYISKFLLDYPVLIERHENYQKQSYRNRCYIYGANGIQSLVIPVKKLHGEKTPITEVAIDFKSNWRHIHLKSIESAYRLSPFYEYYADEITGAFQKSSPLLFDWNMHMIKLILDFCGISRNPATTTSWKETGAVDYRQSLNPKKRLSKPDRYFNPLTYQQVFSDRYGFIANLSIMDLLFNEGPETLSVLKKSITTLQD
jgi:hypothetical protein